MGTLRRLDYWLVELDGANYGRSFSRLCSLSDGTRRGLDHKSGLCPKGLAYLPPHGLCHAHPWLHFQHANPLDRQIQLVRINVEYDRAVHCYRYDSSSRHWD